MTGFLVNLGDLDAWVHQAVLARVDHHHLNHHVDEFRYGAAIPTCENLVTWIVDQLLPALPQGLLLIRAILEEDDSLAATWEATHFEL
jgi:6-pyruvoyl-tetrahydropterin synthase